MNFRQTTDSILKTAAIGLGLLCFAGPAQALDELYGRWIFYKIIYRSEEIPPQNPDLALSMEFNLDNRSTIYWTYDEGRTFCEGRGTYEWDGHLLKNEITWLNPLNLFSCQSEPHLKIGKRTDTPAWIYGGNLHLEMGLGAESYVYVWKKVTR